jgi:hypothetical protein
VDEEDLAFQKVLSTIERHHGQIHGRKASNR